MAEDEDEKPKGDGKIDLRVQFADNEEASFRIKPTTPFSKVYEAIAKSRDIGADTFRLLFDGERIEPHVTPKMLEMEASEPVTVDFRMEQVGGAQ